MRTAELRVVLGCSEKASALPSECASLPGVALGVKALWAEALRVWRRALRPGGGSRADAAVIQARS